MTMVMVMAMSSPVLSRPKTPENALNIAYIAYDSSQDEVFYVKDSQDATEFNGYDLCNYYDDTATPFELDTSTQNNDFNNWPDLVNWPESNPAAATSPPTLEEVAAYPATFVRWTGAQAFAIFFDVSLPSDAQWEYAAKGGSAFVYSVYDGVDTLDTNWNQTLQSPATTAMITLGLELHYKIPVLLG
jgi:hypothetical protein